MAKENDFFETKGLGAGSYPEPNDNGYKCYSFTASVISRINGYVWAKSEEEAEEYINNLEWSEIINESIEEVEDIESLEEE